MKQNLTALGSIHHFLQGTFQVPAASPRALPVPGGVCPLLNINWPLGKFSLGTWSSSHAPGLEFVFVGLLKLVASLFLASEL